jgi:serine/threonine protein kinase
MYLYQIINPKQRRDNNIINLSAKPHYKKTRMISDHSFSEVSCETSYDLIAQDPNHLYENPIFIKNICDGKFPVHLILLHTGNLRLAMKVFPYQDNEVSPYFLNEIRFSLLFHKNVVCIQHYDFSIENNTPKSLQTGKASRLFMEYAPYGDVFEAIINRGIPFNETLTRTYFRQLIDGLEFLHSHGIGHLDLKPENLLLGEDFMLKICDFDLSYMRDDVSVTSFGTCDYRAPELLKHKCTNPYAADIFSIGILLFFMKTQGNLPYNENDKTRYELLQNDNRKFWQAHCQDLEKEWSFFSDDFKELFNSLTRENPDERTKISDIKKSKWYSGKIYSNQELKKFLSYFYSDSSV